MVPFLSHLFFYMFNTSIRVSHLLCIITFMQRSKNCGHEFALSLYLFHTHTHTHSLSLFLNSSQHFLCVYAQLHSKLGVTLSSMNDKQTIILYLPFKVILKTFNILCSWCSVTLISVFKIKAVLVMIWVRNDLRLGSLGPIKFVQRIIL